MNIWKAIALSATSVLIGISIFVSLQRRQLKQLEAKLSFSTVSYVSKDDILEMEQLAVNDLKTKVDPETSRYVTNVFYSFNLYKPGQFCIMLLGKEPGEIGTLTYFYAVNWQSNSVVLVRSYRGIE